jgi:hypothetical protein
VAIKVLHVKPKKTPSPLTRFQREAQIARLEHPQRHIKVPIYDPMSTMGSPLFGHEPIEGQDARAAA